MTKIREFFTKATGVRLAIGASWYAWLPITVPDVEVFRPYIRPSHYAVIDAASAKPDDSGAICSFLRQLLRPHNMRIEARRGAWTVRSSEKEESGPVHIHAGVTVEW